MMDILVPEMRREEGKKLFPEDFFGTYILD